MVVTPNKIDIMQISVILAFHMDQHNTEYDFPKAHRDSPKLQRLNHGICDLPVKKMKSQYLDTSVSEC